MDSPLFFILLFGHLTFLILAVGAVMVTDHFGVRWLRKAVAFDRLLHVAGVTERLVWVGWGGMVLTGVGLIVLKGEVDRLMVIKLYLAGLAGLNGYLLYRILRALRAYEDSDTVPARLMLRLGLSLAVSQVAWWGALLIGFLHRHVQSVIQWPPWPWLWVGLFTAAALGAWGLGEWWVHRRPSRMKVEATADAPGLRKETHADHEEGPVVDPLDRD